LIIFQKKFVDSFFLKEDNILFCS